MIMSGDIDWIVWDELVTVEMKMEISRWELLILLIVPPVSVVPHVNFESCLELGDDTLKCRPTCSTSNVSSLEV